MQKSIAIIVLICMALLATLLLQRHRISIAMISSGEPPALLEAGEEGANVIWFDDYFTIEQIDPRSYAIGEPRYQQQNFNYLLLGDTRAVLFDAGPGSRDIRPVVEALTDLPLTFLPSHFHYDHVGNQVTFAHVAVVDLPYLRARAVDNQLTLTWEEHLGSAEGIEAPTLEVSEWIAPGQNIDLGNRRLRLIYTPGHTRDSVSLLDEDSGQLFSGDFIYPGPLFAFLPNSSLPAYLDAADRVLAQVEPRVSVLGAHRLAPPGAPRLGYHDLKDLQATLRRIRDGEQPAQGVYPAVYRVNDSMELLAEPSWLQGW